MKQIIVAEIETNGAYCSKDCVHLGIDDAICNLFNISLYENENSFKRCEKCNIYSFLAATMIMTKTKNI